MTSKTLQPSLDDPYFNNYCTLPNLDKNITKYTVPCDVYKSMYVEWRCTQHVVLPKNCKVLNQWDLVPL